MLSTPHKISEIMEVVITIMIVVKKVSFALGQWILFISIFSLFAKNNIFFPFSVLQNVKIDNRIKVIVNIGLIIHRVFNNFFFFNII